MNRIESEYQELVKALLGGKVVHGSKYFHLCHPSAQSFLSWVSSKSTVLAASDFNVMRLGYSKGSTGFSISYYSRFFEDSFPSLVWSQKIGLDFVEKSKRFEGINPAILHRKELLLPLNHPNIVQFQRLTEELVGAKILPTRQFIGRREHWNKYLKSLGCEIMDGRLNRV